MGESFPGFAPEMNDDEAIEGFEQQFNPAMLPFGAGELTWVADEPMGAKKGTPTGTVRGNKTDTGNDDSGD